MADNLADIIKKLGKGAVDASAPVSITYGTVTSANPLVITTEQKLPLTKEFLILTKNVKDYETEVTVSWATESKVQNANHKHSVTVTGDCSVTVDQENINLTHNHSIAGRKKITIHNGLRSNDKVILISKQGGEEYIVLDKI